MFAFVKSVLPVFLIFLALASAAVVTFGTATDGSNRQAIYTLDTNGAVLSQVPIRFTPGGIRVNFAANQAKNLFYLWDPWNNNCFDCLFTFDLTNGGSALSSVPMKLPIQCMEASATDYDPKQNQWFFGCQMSFVIMKNGSAAQQFPLSFSPSTVSYDAYTNVLYLTGSGYVHQYNIASNTSVTYKVPPTDIVELSNVVGTPSGEAYIAGHFFNSNQKTYELEWFTIGNNMKNWLVPVENTELKQHRVLGSAAYDADSQSIVWIDGQYLFKYNTASGQVTAHHITYKNTFVPWLTALGVVSLN